MSEYPTGGLHIKPDSRNEFNLDRIVQRREYLWVEKSVPNHPWADKSDTQLNMVQNYLNTSPARRHSLYCLLCLIAQTLVPDHAVRKTFAL